MVSSSNFAFDNSNIYKRDSINNPTSSPVV